MLYIWSIEHDRQNSGALLQSIMGNFKSIVGTSLPYRVWLWVIIGNQLYLANRLKFIMLLNFPIILFKNSLLIKSIYYSPTKIALLTKNPCKLANKPHKITVEPWLSESPLAIQTLSYLNAILNFKIPKDNLIFSKTK